MATLKIYSKDQTDALLANKADTSALPAASQLVPSTSGAASGDVLTVGASGPEWATPGGGSSGLTAHTYNTWEELRQAYVTNGGMILCKGIPWRHYPSNTTTCIASATLTDTNNLSLRGIHRIKINAVGNMGMELVYFDIEILNGSPHYYEAEITYDTSTSIPSSYSSIGVAVTSTRINQIGAASLTNLGLSIADHFVHYY